KQAPDVPQHSELPRKLHLAKNSANESASERSSAESVIITDHVHIPAEKKRIYFDYASVTPVDPRVEAEMASIAKAYTANPSSIYKEGVDAHKKLEDARTRIAACMEAHADEIYFTSGGTEANNLAIQGVLKAALRTNAFANLAGAE